MRDTVLLAHRRSGRAFTLIEMVVSLGVFGVLAIVIITLFVTSLHLNRRSTATHAVVGNVRYTIELMERELRTGTGFLDAGEGILEFTNDRGQTVRYRVENAALQRFNQATNAYEDLTTSAIRVTSADFFELNGQAAGDGLQPRITVVLRVQALADPRVSYDIQTTVSARDLDS